MCGCEKHNQYFWGLDSLKYFALCETIVGAPLSLPLGLRIVGIQGVDSVDYVPRYPALQVHPLRHKWGGDFALRRNHVGAFATSLG